MLRSSSLVLLLLVFFSACHPPLPAGLEVDTGLDPPSLPVAEQGKEDKVPENFFMLNMNNAEAELQRGEETVKLYHCSCYRLKEEVFIQLLTTDFMEGVDGFEVRFSKDTLIVFEVSSFEGKPMKKPTEGVLTLKDYEFTTANTLIGQLEASSEKLSLKGNFHCAVTVPRIQ